MRKSIVILFGLLASACATQEPAQVGRIIIPDVRACMAEYDAEGFIGTQEEYDGGCYKFAAVRF